MGLCNNCPSKFSDLLKKEEYLGWEDSLLFFPCLWRNKPSMLCSPFHFSMCLSRQTSAFFCKAVLQDRQVCSHFMLIRDKCHKHGGTGNLESFCGSVSMGFLDVSAFCWLFPQACRQPRSLSQSLSAWFQRIVSGSKNVPLSTIPTCFTRHHRHGSAALWVEYGDLFFSCVGKERKLLFHCLKQQ